MCLHLFTQATQVKRERFCLRIFYFAFEDTKGIFKVSIRIQKRGKVQIVSFNYVFERSMAAAQVNMVCCPG